MIQDLVVYNKTLKADWQGRQTVILGLLRTLVASQPGGYHELVDGADQR